MVIRGDSCPRGVSSNPSIRYLMYNFSHLLDVKYYCCFKRPKIYEKEACNVPFYEKITGGVSLTLRSIKCDVGSHKSFMRDALI